MDQGAEGEARTPGDLEVELFPCKGGCQDISVLPAGAHSGPDGRTVRAGLPASAVLPPIHHLPLPRQPWKPTHLTRVASSPTPSWLLPPLSYLQGIKRIARQGQNAPLLSPDALQSSGNTLLPLTL